MKEDGLLLGSVRSARRAWRSEGIRRLSATGGFSSGLRRPHISQAVFPEYVEAPEAMPPGRGTGRLPPHLLLPYADLSGPHHQRSTLQAVPRLVPSETLLYVYR